MKIPKDGCSGDLSKLVISWDLTRFWNKIFVSHKQTTNKKQEFLSCKAVVTVVVLWMPGNVKTSWHSSRPQYSTNFRFPMFCAAPKTLILAKPPQKSLTSFHYQLKAFKCMQKLQGFLKLVNTVYYTPFIKASDLTLALAGMFKL